MRLLPPILVFLVFAAATVFVDGRRRALGHRVLPAVSGTKQKDIEQLWDRALKAQGREARIKAMMLASDLTSADERSPAAWRFLAWTRAASIAPNCTSPEERWLWTAAALDALEDGRARIPSKDFWRLDLDLAWLYEKGLAEEGLRTRFRNDSRRNPQGLHPILFALKAVERAAHNRDDMDLEFQRIRVLLEALREPDVGSLQWTNLEGRAKVALTRLGKRLPAGSDSHLRLADFQRELDRLLRARGKLR